MSIFKKTFVIANLFLAFSANASDPYESFEGQKIYTPGTGWTEVQKDYSEKPIPLPKTSDIAGYKNDGSRITNTNDKLLTVPPSKESKAKSNSKK